MRVRCPNCQDSTEVDDNSELSNIACPSCGSQFSLLGEETLAHDQAAAKTIGQFELVDQLGVGAFGSVWMARDTQLDRSVAVKIPRKGQLDAGETEQFVREARAAAQLKHPNIVAVHEVGREDGQVYIVSDYVDGLTLADWLVGQPLTSRTAAQLSLKLAEALHHAHEAGVIHRDLKPTNIILDSDNEPHIMDFGLAKREAGEVTMTMEGKVLGTPAYMSPEQAKGDAHQADRRSDVYSLGVILYELLTGHKPFRGNVRMLLQQVVNEDAPSPRRLNSSIPRDLETLCLKCLEKDPRKRYPTAKEVAADLSRFLRGEPVEARPITAPDRAWRWCKRNPLVAGLTLTVALSLLFGVGVSYFYAMQANARAEDAEFEKSRADAKATEAEESLQLAMQRSYELQRTLYAADTGLAQQAIQNNDFGTGMKLLKGLVPQPGEHELRGWEWSYLWQLGQSPSERLAWTPVSCWSVVIVSGSNDLAFGTYFGEVYYLTGGRDPELIATGLGMARLASSPGGTKLAATGSESSVVRRWKLPERTELPSLSVGDAADWKMHSLAYSGDSKRLAVFAKASPEGPQVVVWDLHDSVIVGRFAASATNNGFFAEVCLSFDGSRAFVGGADGSLRAHDVATGDLLWIVRDAHPESLTALDLSDDDSLLATGAGFTDSSIKLWDARNGEAMVETLKGHTEFVRALRFSSDGNLLASAGGDQTAKIWDVRKAEELQSIPVGSIPHDLALSTDGQTLITGDATGDVRRWQVDTRASRQPYVSRRVGRERDALSFDPSGRFMLTIDANQHVVLLNPFTLETLRSIDPLGVVTGPIALSSGGEFIAAAKDNETVVYDLVDERIVAVIPRFAVRSFLDDGQVLFGLDAARGEGKLVEVGTWQEMEPIGLPVGILASDFSPGARQAAFRISGREIVFGPFSLKAGFKPAGSDMARILMWGMCFSPDGRFFATCDSDREAEIFDSSSGQRMFSLRGHHMIMSDISFLGEQRIATGGDGRTALILWDVESRRELVTLAVEKAVWLRNITASPDGTIIAGLSDNNGKPVLHRWYAPPLEAAALSHSGDGR